MDEVVRPAGLCHPEAAVATGVSLRSWGDREIEALGDGRAVAIEAALGPSAAAVSAALAALDDDLRPAGMGRQKVVRSAIRGDETAWIGEDAVPAGLEPLGRWFADLRELANRSCWLGLGRFEIQVARYLPGAAYARHRDAFLGFGGRRLTAIWYANPGWTDADGGELVAFEPQGPRAIAPILDRAVVFLSDRLEHEVRPAVRVRRAVTAWYRGPDDPG